MPETPPTLRCLRCGIHVESGDRCPRCAASDRGEVPAPRNPASRFAQGLTSPFRALGLLLEPGNGLFRFFVLPFLISLLVIAVLGGLGAWGFFELREWAVGEEANTAENAASVAAALIFALIYVILSYYFFHILGPIVAGPFLEPLSRKVEANVLGARGGDAIGKGLFREAAWSVTQGLGLLGIGICVFALSAAMQCIPFVGQGLAILVISMGLALEYLDFSLARKRYSFGEKLGFLFRNKASARGLRLGVWLLLLIPLGVLIVIPISAMAATLVFLDTPWMTPASPAAPPGAAASGENASPSA